MPPKSPLDTLLPLLVAIPGVVAITLGGSRASGTNRPDSDWDIGIYYRGRLDTDAIRRLGLPGDVWEPGAWGPVMNGGACVLVNGQPVDLIYRDLDAVDAAIDDAQAGRFTVAAENGSVCGVPSYLYAVELSQSRVLSGVLPQPTLGAALQRHAAERWREAASFDWETAAVAAARGDSSVCVALLARAVLATAHARLIERAQWPTNEKGLAARAGLGVAADRAADIGSTPAAMISTVRFLQRELEIPAPRDLLARRALTRAGVLDGLA